MKDRVHTTSPEAISSTLMEAGFHLPGKETHIPLGLKPYGISREQYEQLQATLPMLAGVMLKASQYDQTQKGFTPSEEVPPFIWRFDFLATSLNGYQPEDSSHHSYRMLELNATRPGGIFLLIKALEAHRALGNNGNHWVPLVNELGDYFSRIAYRNGNGHKVVGLAHTDGYVAQVEMPGLASLLNSWSQEKGTGIDFISAERRLFEAKGGTIYGPDGEKIDVFYENAGPKEVDGEIELFRFSDNYPGTVLINPPETATADNKTLMAHLFDKEFRKGLSPAEIEVIDRYVPTTILVTSINDFKRLQADGNIKSCFLKIGNGLRASSGKGVYNGKNLTEKDLAEIFKALQEGDRFVAQSRIPPEAPWYPVTMVDCNTIHTEYCYVDFDPFVLYDGRKISLSGALCRAKPEHPINISQGGVLLTASIN